MCSTESETGKHAIDSESEFQTDKRWNNGNDDDMVFPIYMPTYLHLEWFNFSKICLQENAEVAPENMLTHVNGY